MVAESERPFGLATAADVHATAALVFHVATRPSRPQSITVEGGAREHADPAALRDAIRVGRAIEVRLARDAAEPARKVAADVAVRIAVTIARALRADHIIDRALIVPPACDETPSEHTCKSNTLHAEAVVQRTCPVDKRARHSDRGRSAVQERNDAHVWDGASHPPGKRWRYFLTMPTAAISVDRCHEVSSSE